MAATMSDSVAKKYKIKSCFAYHEEKTSDTEVVFGWISMDVDNLKAPFVISYGSKSKFISEEDAEWSKQAGVNAASFDDYYRYFTSLTGDSPDDFLGKWSSDAEKLEDLRRQSSSKYRDGEGAFLLSLAGLLKNGGKFTQYGRIFKLIKDDT
jgi:hypothetical protein